MLATRKIVQGEDISLVTSVGAFSAIYFQDKIEECKAVFIANIVIVLVIFISCLKTLMPIITR